MRMGDFDLRNSNGTRMAGIVALEDRAIGLRHNLSKAQLRHHLPLLYLDVYENGRKLKPDAALGADGSVIFRNDKRAIRIRLSEKEFANPGQPPLYADWDHSGHGKSACVCQIGTGRLVVESTFCE